MIFTSIFLLIWTYFAYVRFVSAVEVRLSTLRGKLVVLRGLGGPLSSLIDMTQSGHVHAVLNTRQSHPPSRLRSMIFPFALPNKSEKMYLSQLSSSNTSTLHLLVDVQERVEVFLLLDFNIEKFREYMKNLENSQRLNGHGSAAKQFVADFAKRSELANRLQKLVHSESCSGISYVQCLDRGAHELHISLGSYVSQSGSFGIVLLPCNGRGGLQQAMSMSMTKSMSMSMSHSPSSSSSSSMSHSLHNNVHNALISHTMEESETLVDNSNNNNNNSNNNNSNNSHGNTNMTSSISSSSSSMTSASNVEWILGIAVVSGNLNNAMNVEREQRTALTNVDNLVFGNTGTVYSAQEVFGWMNRPTASGGDPQGQGGGLAQGGSTGVDEECVVCLCEKKDVVLLPCRHLCVCRQCLLHIDKCPVCRSTYNEFIVQVSPGGPQGDVANV